MSDRRIQDFFGKAVSVINVGLTGMAQSLKEQGVPVINLDWQPILNSSTRKPATALNKQNRY
jgi:hypothetical protein